MSYLSLTVTIFAYKPTATDIRCASTPSYFHFCIRSLRSMRMFWNVQNIRRGPANRNIFVWCQIASLNIISVHIVSYLIVVHWYQFVVDSRFVYIPFSHTYYHDIWRHLVGNLNTTIRRANMCSPIKYKNRYLRVIIFTAGLRELVQYLTRFYNKNKQTWFCCPNVDAEEPISVFNFPSLRVCHDVLQERLIGHWNDTISSLERLYKHNV